MNIIISFIFLSFGANAQDCVQAVVEYTKAVEELRLQSPDVQRLWEEEYGKARDEYNRAQEELRETPIIKNLWDEYQRTLGEYDKAVEKLLDTLEALKAVTNEQVLMLKNISEKYQTAKERYERDFNTNWEMLIERRPVIKNISEKYQETRTKYEKAEKELVEQSPYVQELREKIKELCWDRIWQVFKP